MTAGTSHLTNEQIAEIISEVEKLPNANNPLLLKSLQEQLDIVRIFPTEVTYAEFKHDFLNNLKTILNSLI
jgi:hypothetical protein